MSIKVSELFASIQGEGLYMGVPSVFLRTFGCNFSCGGFGMKRGELSKERFDIDPKKFNDYKELPLVSTGCDSYASWDPRFKHLSPLLTIPAIVDRIVELLPGNNFSQDKHLIITGGEPLLGWQKQFVELFREIDNRNLDLGYVTFETNGTKPLVRELEAFISERCYNFGKHAFTFSISAKLPCSGEKWEDAIKPEVVKQYIDTGAQCYFKFVVSTHEDIEDVKRALAEYKSHGINIPTYLMPVGGTNDVYQLNERQVADFCRDNGYRFSARLQVPLYKNQWGT